MRFSPKLAHKLLFGLASLAVLAGSAEAGQKIIKKRVGFFESLFGGAPRSPSHPIFAGSSDRLTWWEQRQLEKQNGGYDSNGVRFFYGKGNQNFDGAEPDPLPGLGLGVMEYAPPQLVPVYDASFLKFTTSSQDAEAIRIELINKATTIRTVDVERKAVLAFYSTNEFKPVWTANGHVMPRAVSMLKSMAGSSSDGLVPKNYLPAGFTSFDDVDKAIAGDGLKLARFDIAMSVVALKYARQLSGGQFDPNRLSLYNDIKPQPVNADQAMKVLGFSPYPDSYAAGLAPTIPQYAVFKSALSKLSGDGNKLDVIADGPIVKTGQSDDRIPAVRLRLQGLGITVPELDAKADPKLLDKKLAASLRNFQAASKMKASGLLDPATLKLLNADHSADERQRLVYNMERLRWLPKNLGTRHVLVNQAAFEVNVFDHDKAVWHSKVIVGKPMNQTYAFSDQIETVVFNPSWGVPASIIVNEYGPKSRKDPGYLDRNGFKIVDANGNEISSRDVNWWSLGQAPTIGVQQPPGSDNALGELKFLFPNAHDIYMHDTPTKNLFGESSRAFSHGCVRVQNPREFAAVLLGWSQEQVSQNLGKAGKSKSIDGLVDSHSVNLSEKVPVHLTYFTAWSDKDGKIQYYNDIYGRDAAMAKAFAYDGTAKKSNNTKDLTADVTIEGGISQN